MQNGLIFVVLVYPGCLGKDAINWVSVIPIHNYARGYCSYGRPM